MAKMTLHATASRLSMKSLDPLVKDTYLTVPPRSEGEFFQILDDTDVLGAARQVVDGQPFDFDFPAIANKKWGIHTRYPGFDGTEYEYIELSDAWIRTIYAMLEWGASHLLPRGDIVDYVERNDGTYAVVSPVASMWWVWTELIVKGKSHTEGAPVEYGRRDPITGRNPNAENFLWLARPFTKALKRRTEMRGSKWGYEVLNTLQPPPSLESIIARPWLWEWAVTIKREMVDGRYIVDDYPTIAEAFKRLNYPRTGTPVLSLGKGETVWIDKSACSPILEPGSRWSPYYPEKT